MGAATYVLLCIFPFGIVVTAAFELAGRRTYSRWGHVQRRDV